MKCTVKCYYKTGFDFSNIPDSPGLLETVTDVKIFDSVYVKQNRNLINLKIASTYDNIKDADYLSLNDNVEIVYYFIAGVNMINDNVVNLTLVEDTLTTIGGAINLDYLDGWCTRRCVIDDTLFSNILEESFTPKQNLEISNLIELAKSTDSDDNKTLIGATVNLGTIGYTATTYSDSEGNTVVVPKTPDSAGNTPIKIEDPDGSNVTLTNIIPNLNIYNFDNQTVKDNISIARSLGIESSITSCYRVPENYIDGFSENIDLKQSTLKSTIKTEDSSIAVSYGNYIPNNNKCNILFNTIHLVSISSAEEIEYPIYYVADKVSRKVSFITFADISPDGYPFCRPYVYLNVPYYVGENLNHLFLTGIKGSKWQNTPITFTGASNQSQLDYDLSYAKKSYEITHGNTHDNAMLNREREGSMAFKGLTNGVKNISNIAASIANKDVFGAVNGGINLVGQGFSDYDSYKQFQKQTDIDVENTRNLADLMLDKARFAYEFGSSVVVPKIVFPRANSLQNYIGNSFMAYRVGLTDTDKKNFDDYLTRYGYRTSEPITQYCFKGRENFNFVEGSGILIGNEINLRRKNNVEQIFNNGVRVWHKLPTLNLLQSNPIVVSK